MKVAGGQLKLAKERPGSQPLLTALLKNQLCDMRKLHSSLPPNTSDDKINIMVAHGLLQIQCIKCSQTLKSGSSKNIKHC